MKSPLVLCMFLGVVLSIRAASLEAVTVTTPFTTNLMLTDTTTPNTDVTGLYDDITTTPTIPTTPYPTTTPTTVPTTPNTDVTGLYNDTTTTPTVPTTPYPTTTPTTVPTTPNIDVTGLYNNTTTIPYPTTRPTTVPTTPNTDVTGLYNDTTTTPTVPTSPYPTTTPTTVPTTPNTDVTGLYNETTTIPYPTTRPTTVPTTPNTDVTGLYDDTTTIPYPTTTPTTVPTTPNTDVTGLYNDTTTIPYPTTTLTTVPTTPNTDVTGLYNDTTTIPYPTTTPTTVPTTPNTDVTGLYNDTTTIPYPTTTPTTVPTTPNTDVTGLYNDTTTIPYPTTTLTTVPTTPNTDVTGLHDDSGATAAGVPTTPYTTPVPPPTGCLPHPPLMTTTPPAPQMMCPDGWEFFQGRCYFFVDDTLNWPQALSHCAMLESTLVSVHSPREYGFLQQLTGRNGNQYGWLGGFYLQDQAIWIDGSWIYNNWGSESSHSSAPCLLLSSSEEWSNSPCITGNTFICVKYSNVSPEMLCPEGWTGFHGRCYYHNQEYLTWPEADTLCAGQQASLVSVTTPEQYSFLYEQTYALGFSAAWLGGFYIDDQWLWLDGSWFYQGLLNQMSGDSVYSCLSTGNLDGWISQDCDQRLFSFCVKDPVV